MVIVVDYALFNCFTAAIPGHAYITGSHLSRRDTYPELCDCAEGAVMISP